jgi:hypothetical protein
VYCVARDKNGVFKTCSSTDSRILDAVNTITDGSYISFTLEANGWQCRDLQIGTYSYDQ